MQFFLDIIPPTRTAQQKGESIQGGRIVHYVKKEVREAEDTLRTALRPHRPPMPLDGPLMLICDWQFPAGKSHKDGEWRITRPDTDNLQKLLKDCLTKEGFWIDDSRVCYDVCKKSWSDAPGILVTILPLEEMSV
jgi:Holliday junction resolvase RusA-like endonuclease